MEPFPGYCSHPIDKAWHAGCPIAHERAEDDEVSAVADKLPAKTDPAMTRLAGMRADLERGEKPAIPKGQALERANRAFAQGRQRHQDAPDKLKAPSQEAARIDAPLLGYRLACGDLAIGNNTRCACTTTNNNSSAVRFVPNPNRACFFNGKG